VFSHDLDPLGRGLADGEDLRPLCMFGVHPRLTLSGRRWRSCALPSL
jgi:hypothetical protein